MLNKLRLRLRALFFKSKMEDELQAELRFHLEREIEENIARGMSPEEARYAALRSFGGVERIKEESRDVRGIRLLEEVWQDLHYGARMMLNRPSFSLITIFILALGIAASVAIFAFVDAALLQPLPYKNPSSLVVAYETTNSCRECDLSYPDYLDWKKANTVFSSFEAWDASVVYLWRSSEGVQAVRSARVSGGFFRSLGVAAMLGRAFTDADDTPAAPRAVLLTYGAWQSRFGGRQDIVGQSLILDDSPYTVIGVLPREFHFAMRAAEFFTTIHDPNPCEQTRGCRDIYGLGRLRDGVSLQAAAAETKAIAAHLEKEYPDSNKGRSARLVPLRDAIVGDIRPTLLVLSSGAGLLLLIAYVNVASLLLVRAESRRRETVLRGVLGASLGRLVRQFVTEGVAPVTVAVVLAMPAASAAIPWLFKLIPERRLRGMPYFREVGLHPRVLLFAVAVSLLAVVVFSVTPVLRLSLSDLRENLADGGRGSGTLWKRFGSNLVAAELAIVMVLLASAGLLGKSLYRMLHVDLNFNPANLATLEIDVHGVSYGKDDQRMTLSRRLLEHISAMPGVISAAHTNDLPVTCNCNSTQFRVLGHPWYGEHDTVLKRETSADYFKVLQARLISGRFYTDSDDTSKPRVVIINRALVKRFFPGEDPVGKTIGDPDLSPKSLAQIVGVVDDIREGELIETIVPTVYYPFNQGTDRSFFIVVRTGQDPAPMMPALVVAIHQVASNLGVRNEFVMDRRINDSSSAFLNRSAAWLVGGFAVSALLLGAIGLYGVIAYSVSQRTREIGIRMALGAQSRDALRLIVGQGMKLALIGIVIGLAGALVLTRLLKTLLFGVSATDPLTFAVVVLLLAAVALLACYVPARRAAKVDPLASLRCE